MSAQRYCDCATIVAIVVATIGIPICGVIDNAFAVIISIDMFIVIAVAITVSISTTIAAGIAAYISIGVGLRPHGYLLYPFLFEDSTYSIALSF